MADRTFVATFHGATRKNNSTNGNPTWTLHTSDGDYTTQTDGSVGYSVSNYTGGPSSLIGKRVTFTVSGTGRGRVSNMNPEGE